MFGKEAIYNIIRQNPHAGAAKVQDAVLTELKQFQQGVEPADDITLVIIKIEGNR
jgi:serine phosphatase RsbU (regulator of sigma subunit)